LGEKRAGRANAIGPARGPNISGSGQPGGTLELFSKLDL